MARRAWVGAWAVAAAVGAVDLACGSSAFENGEGANDSGAAGDVAIDSPFADAGADLDADAALPMIVPPCPVPGAKHGVDTLGVYSQDRETVDEGNCFDDKLADHTDQLLDGFPFAFAGDWNGDGADEPGLYDPVSGTFRLHRVDDAGGDAVFVYGGVDGGELPLIGDWNGDGVDTIGVYDPASSGFFLHDSNTSGAGEYTVVFSSPKGGGAPLVPIAGDWDGDGKTSIGVYDPDTSKFYLRNILAGGAADIVFVFGHPGDVPLVGDWDGDQRSGVGVYDPTTGVVELENVAGAHPADIRYTLPPGLHLVVGDWDGT